MGNQGPEPNWGWTQEVFTCVAAELLAAENPCKSQQPEATVQSLFREADSTTLNLNRHFVSIRKERSMSGIKMSAYRIINREEEM